MMPKCFLPFFCLCALFLTFHQASATLVTFRVDLTQESSISPNGIHIVGPFNSWDPAATSLSQVTPGRYEITLFFATGWQAIYKFVNGNAWGNEEGVFGGCAFNTYRFFRVPASDTILPWVCFGHCDSACTPAPGTRVACVGNSITYGWDLTDPVTQSFPSILQDSLGSGFLVLNSGAPGAAVIRSAGNPYVNTEQFRHLIRFGAEEMFLLLGINDSKQPIWGPHSAEFAADYDSLWMAIDTLANTRKIWICLPTTAFSPFFGIQAGVVTTEIVPKIRAHARLKALDQIDLHGFTAGMVAHFPDSTHPDSVGTRLIAQEIYRIRQMARPQVDLSGTLPSVASGYAWQWYLNGDTVPTSWGGRSQSLTFAPTGHYKVGVQVDGQFEHILISDSVSFVLADYRDDLSFKSKLYPNPASGSLEWEVPTAENMQVAVRVFAIDGKLELSFLHEGNKGSIDVSRLARGNYVFEAEANGKYWHRVFTK